MIDNLIEVRGRVSFRVVTMVCSFRNLKKSDVLVGLQKQRFEAISLQFVLLFGFYQLFKMDLATQFRFERTFTFPTFSLV